MSRMAKHYFPGGNTTEGFYNYYDFIVDRKDIYHIYCIKGGPGVGKSTFMKKMAQEAKDRGETVEYYHCSSDPASLDGVLLVEKRILFVDGTAPHIMDPKFPGAVDTILDFGAFFDQNQLKEHKEAIMDTTQAISASFQRAYKYLASIKPVYEGLKRSYRDCVNFKVLHKTTQFLADEIFQGRKGDGFSQRKLFLSAITPDGVIHYVNETIQAANIYILMGKMGDHSSEIIDRLIHECRLRDFKIETFYCPISPNNKVDHILIPEIDTAIVSSNYHHPFDKGGVRVDVSDLYCPETMEQSEILFLEKIAKELLDAAVRHIKQAKKTHDELEEFYKKAMDYDRLNSFIQNFKEEI